MTAILAGLKTWLATAKSATVTQTLVVSILMLFVVLRLTDFLPAAIASMGGHQDKAHTWLTHAFLHSSLTHLVSNLLPLIVIGPFVEARISSWIYGFAFLAITICAVRVGFEIMPAGPATSYPPHGMSAWTYALVPAGIYLLARKLFETHEARMVAFFRAVWREKASWVAVVVGLASAIWLANRSIDSDTPIVAVVHSIGALGGLVILIAHATARTFKIRRLSWRRAKRGQIGDSDPMG